MAATVFRRYLVKMTGLLVVIVVARIFLSPSSELSSKMHASLSKVTDASLTEETDVSNVRTSLSPAEHTALSLPPALHGVSSPPPCEDHHRMCAKWAAKGECAARQSMAIHGCCLSCNALNATVKAQFMADFEKASSAQMATIGGKLTRLKKPMELSWATGQPPKGWNSTCEVIAPVVRDLRLPHVVLFMSVFTGPLFGNRRSAVRESWLSNLPAGTDYRFMIGAPADISLAPVMQRELELYGDIVRLAVPDVYANLDRKALACLQYVLATFNFDYHVKIDDDIFADIRGIMRWLETAPPERAYMGGFWGGSYEFLAVHKQSNTPCFVSGPAYFLSQDVVAHVLLMNPVREREIEGNDVSMGRRAARWCNVHRRDNINFIGRWCKSTALVIMDLTSRRKTSSRDEATQFGNVSRFNLIQMHKNTVEGRPLCYNVMREQKNPRALATSENLLSEKSRTRWNLISSGILDPPDDGG